MIHPPRSLIDQLDDLDPREKLIALYGIQAAFTRLMNDPLWRKRIDAALLELRPTQEDHESIMMAAGKVCRALKAELLNAANAGRIR